MFYKIFVSVFEDAKADYMTKSLPFRFLTLKIFEGFLSGKYATYWPFELKIKKKVVGSRTFRKMYVIYKANQW